MNQVAEFYRHELTQALNEQAFGICCSEMICSTENEAEADVTLLEGNTIHVVLSSAGHKVWRQRTRRFYIYLSILDIGSRNILRDFGQSLVLDESSLCCKKSRGADGKAARARGQGVMARREHCSTNPYAESVQYIFVQIGVKRSVFSQQA